MNTPCNPCKYTVPLMTANDQNNEPLHTGIVPLASVTRWLDITDMLEQYHISSRTLQTWRSKCGLRFSKIGKKIYFDVRDVETFLSRNLRNHTTKLVLAFYATI